MDIVSKEEELYEEALEYNPEVKIQAPPSPEKASYFQNMNLDDPIIYSNLSDKE